MTSYLIIGAGNFGAATALSLSRRNTTLKITLVDTADFPNPRAASHDVSKIVRDDYPDKLYMRMLIKAMPMWRKDGLYSPYYHEVGMLRADASTFGQESMAAYKDMDVANDSIFIPVSEARGRWNGAFATANFDGLDKVLYNPTVGFAEADRALGAVIKEAVDHGVEYVVGVLKRLNFAANGECIGATLEDGNLLQADKILLATGARTASLLAQSAPDNKRVHAGDRVVAAGAVSFCVTLVGKQLDKFASVPVIKNCLPLVKGEGMSALMDGTIKINCDMCFTNYVSCPQTSELMSMVPDENLFNMWTGPKFINFFQERARRTIEGLYGKDMNEVTIDAYRICWDAITPTRDFLISPHPHCPGLYVAAGGSFHGWKFLPVIGDYIADMMHNCLDADYVDRWAWDKGDSYDSFANPTYQVVGDLQHWIS
ncbi:sarcosine oxidase [Purpureocillium lavendulum]|uniref:Sarcosine oxidase n=1 Tax=Purpureocillium lavendulum TaxID=1247861 RepID=A0AB34FB83_9HYPO|nr:sarcosine oxidase [Purpureocillium lavendulum]